MCNFFLLFDFQINVNLLNFDKYFISHLMNFSTEGNVHALVLQERQTAREGSDAPCAFRISSEGLPLILPYITKQIIQASPVDFKHLLQDKDVKFTDFADAEFGKKAENLLPGCCVIVLGKGMYPR